MEKEKVAEKAAVKSPVLKAGLKTSYVPSTPTTTIATCGSLGSITIGSVTGEIQNWVLNHTVDAIDVTSMNSDSWREHIGCLQGGDGTFETFIPMCTLGSQAGVVFSQGGGGDDYTADVIIKSIKTTVDVSDAVKFVYGFDVTGEIT